jgi:ABC-type polysaccharide/polyol phosphate export permease
MNIQNSIPVISNEGSKWFLALQDVIGGVLNYRLWWSISWHEVRQRYRRSMLGPFWMTLSMGVQALVLGLLFGFLFNHQTSKFLPFVCAGLVTWSLITSCIQEGANTFIGSAGALTQMRRPLTSYVMRTIARNIIVFFHSIVIFFVVAILFGIYPTLTSLWSLVGLFLVLINLGWMSLFSAIVSTRYRDVPMIIQNVFSVLLWLTPVMYYPSQLTGRPALIIQLNPFSYFLDVVRGPLMNELPKVESFALVAVCAVVGWLSTLMLFSRTRSRIVYWL